MKKINLPGFKKAVPAVIVGCMRQAGFTDQPFSPEQMNHFIHTALEHDACFFDHANIYGFGRAEEIFGKAVSMDASIRREDLIIQTKCGLANGYYDSSKEHILTSVDESLKRLQTDYLDILLLHRPDALLDPAEVAEAFDLLFRAGKVRHFGVSNYRPSQMDLLLKYLDQPLIVNQMEFSIVHSGMIKSGMESNMTTPGSFDRDGDVLNYCRINDITLQAWSPFQISLHDGSFIDHPDYPELNEVLSDLAETYRTSKTGIALAWIMRHPAGFQTLTGTTKEERLIELAKASEIVLTKEEWYRLYLAAGNILP